MAVYGYVWLRMARGWKLNNWSTIVSYSLLFSPNYSLFISIFFVIFIIHFFSFCIIFLCQIFYNVILYIVYQKFTFKYTFNLIFSKYHPIFSINVVKITLSFSIKRPSMQLLERVREGPNNSSLITLSTKKKNKQTIAETNTFHNRNHT